MKVTTKGHEMTDSNRLRNVRKSQNKALLFITHMQNILWNFELLCAEWVRRIWDRKGAALIAAKINYVSIQNKSLIVIYWSDLKIL